MCDIHTRPRLFNDAPGKLQRLIPVSHVSLTADSRDLLIDYQAILVYASLNRAENGSDAGSTHGKHGSAATSWIRYTCDFLVSLVLALPGSNRDED
jgi:hypothetical protein